MTGCLLIQVGARRGRSSRFVPAVVFLLGEGKTDEVLIVLNEYIHLEQGESSSTLDLGFAAA